MSTLTSLLDGNLAFATTWTLLHSLWQCGLIALLLWLWLRLNRNLSASSRYTASCLALVACSLASVGTFWQLYHSAVAAESLVASGVNLWYSNPLLEQLYRTLNRQTELILSLWTLGFLGQSVTYLRNILQVRYLRQSARPATNLWTNRTRHLAERLQIPRPVAIGQSAKVAGICTIGHWRPLILVPVGLLTRLPTEQVEALILHELAHVRRNDYLVNLLLGIVKLFFFFNPAVLWLGRQIDQEREEACDDIAVSHCGDPRTYAEGLAGSASLQRQLSMAMAAHRHGYRLLPRIQRLFINPTGRFNRSFEQMLAVLCALGVALAVNVSAAELRPPRQPEAPTPSQSITDAAPAQPSVSSQPAPPALPRQPSVPSAVDSLDPVTATAALDYQVAARPARVPAIQPAPRVQPLAQAIPLESASESAITRQPPTLAPVKVPEFNQLLLAEAVRLPRAHKAYLEAVEVQFADIWLSRFQGKTSTSYRQYVISDYGSELQESLRESLQNAGWQVVATPDPQSVRIKARLIDLYIFEPETPGIKDTIIAQAGQAGIQLAISSPEGDVFMAITDHRTTGDTSAGPALANRSNNLYYFKRLMNKWADAATLYLNEVSKLAAKQNNG